MLQRYSCNDAALLDSIGGLTGTLYGGATLQYGYLSLGSTSQYALLPTTILGSYLSATIELWLSAASTGQAAFANILEWDNSPLGRSGGNWLQIYRNSYNNIYVTFNDGSWHDGASTATMDGETNMHLVLTVTQGDYLRLYKNGVLISTSTAVYATFPTGKFIIGSGGTYAGVLGSVDEIRIYGRALTPTEILSSYYNGKGMYRSS